MVWKVRLAKDAKDSKVVWGWRSLLVAFASFARQLRFELGQNDSDRKPITEFDEKRVVRVRAEEPAGVAGGGKAREDFTAIAVLRPHDV
jgi:hypothetical protein